MGFNVGGGFAAIIRKGAVDTATRANNSINALNAKTGNDVRQAQNAATAAQDNLARFTQSVNNNKVLTAGGNAQAALTVNALRGSDAHMAQDFSGSIAQAEQAGHMAASAASAGVDGNVVDMVDTSTALRNSIIGQQVKTSEDESAYDVGQKRGQIASQMVSGMDQSLILDHLNYNVDVAKTQGLTNVFSAALQGFFPNGTDSGLADSLQSAKTTVGNWYDQATGPSAQEKMDTAMSKFDWSNPDSIPDTDAGGSNPYSIDSGTPFDTTGEKSNLYGLWSG